MSVFVRFAFMIGILLAVIAPVQAGMTVGVLTSNPVRGVGTEENFAIGIDELTADSLTESRMLDLGLDLSNFNSPLLDYELSYLRSILSSNATTVADWQSDIGNKGSQEAAQWKLERISDETDNSTELTHAMIDAAVGAPYSSSAIISARGEDLSTLQTFWSTASFDTSSPSSIKTFIATSVLLSNTVFASSAEGDAYVANADSANYSVANFSACYASTDSISGGANTCSITSSQWTAFDALHTAVTDNSTTNITKANLDAVFGADNSS
ncbi:MAG: hypothetical protein J4F41_06465 [Alphaproteobacteria bacterium]|nr:hypothetical protein [Alphaproteobacteria bacterium]